MSLPANLSSIAALALDRMLYGLVEGVLLAALLSLAMRLFPPRNSRTRFAVWLAALMAVVMLPLLGIAGIAAGHERIFAHDAGSVASATPLFTIPAAWAESILAVWAALALAGLLRVAVGLWHVRRLRRSCVAIQPELLCPELGSAIAELKLSRPVSILVSPNASVPAAVGFVKPIVVVPAWLAEESAAGELQYVLLHELAHLRRWDDWTNLLQKIVKAVLFFHPGIWWIERKLALDREMACDEAVLSELPEPRRYAECLARVAEKSFLRRQLALAQAAVDRVKHLSYRIARILNVGSTQDQCSARTTRLWKPAVTMVAIAGTLGAVWTAQAPVLVGLAGPPTSQTEVAGGSSAVITTANAPARQVALHQNNGAQPVPVTSVKSKSRPAVIIPALYGPIQAENRNAASSSPQQNSGSRARKSGSQLRRPELLQAQFMPSETAPDAPGEMLITVVETQWVTGGQTSGALWQVSVVQVRWVARANHAKKEIPRKT